MENNQRKAFDEAIAAMSLSVSPYFKEYYFYLHLIAQCKVVYDESMSAPAAVSYSGTRYTLHLNPRENLGVTQDGSIWHGFCESMPLEHRLGVLKHEMSHICLGHLIDISKLDMKKHNYATDCALNQRINKDHLPKGCIFPDNFPTKEKNVLPFQNNEYYYSIIDLDSQSESNNGSSQSGEGDGSGTGNGRVLDDHSKWTEGNTTDPETQKEVTRKMVEKAGEAAYKAIGSFPSEYLQMLENLAPKNDVKWEKYIKNVLGSRKANKRKTIMRKNRRLPNANWIKGCQKDRVLDIAVISDVSGSVSNEVLKSLWERLLTICKTFKTPITVVQVDTLPTTPEKLTLNTKTIERKANGGTILHPAINKLHEHNVKYSVLVVTTDGYLSSEDVVKFKEVNVPVIWLISHNGNIKKEMNQGNMKAIKLERL